jgi:hypothetical protein
MRGKARFVLASLILLLAAAGAAAKDFPESFAAADPLAACREDGSPAGMGGAFEYGNYCIARDGEVDSFFLRSSLSPVLFASEKAFALGALYEVDLLCGPVGAGQTAANVADFWMNAVQFEYGLYASLRLPSSPELHLLAEYSRTSQHPLRSGNAYEYSQVTADILSLGLSLPSAELGEFAVRAYLRFGYRDLFGFWRSDLPRPRVSWIQRGAIEAKLPLKGRFFLVARGYPDLFVDRYERRLDGDFLAELGIALAKGDLDDEILLTCYGTRDTDLLLDEANPAFEAGIVCRLALSRL